MLLPSLLNNHFLSGLPSLVSYGSKLVSLPIRQSVNNGNEHNLLGILPVKLFKLKLIFVNPVKLFILDGKLPLNALPSQYDSSRLGWLTKRSSGKGPDKQQKLQLTFF